MNAARSDLPRYVESKPLPNAVWTFLARKIPVGTWPIHAFFGGLASGIIVTLFTVLILSLLD